MERNSLTRFAWLSIAAALATIALKTSAYFLTGSVGLLSDAVESLVNLAGGIMALLMLRVAARPADDDHAYGHSKAEYFSSGVEGTLILLASASIAYTAVARLLHPQPLEHIGSGLAVSFAASAVNLVVALVILRAGKRRNSITLEANAHHLLTDVWTSVGVVAAIGAVACTGWNWLDPVVALLVAANIVRTGVGIVRRSVAGLMDAALAPADLAKIDAVLATHRTAGVQFHNLRTREAGARKFVNFDVLVPGLWTVQQGHDLVEQIEGEIRDALPDSTVFTHLEPVEDPASWSDAGLDRSKQSPSATGK
ncbi:MAG TPA: cation diffusion facilitator family transporter [Opitutaceae bacterium]|nr:cation diffusion facilitator family transporter [Opitutaceae bacterium]